MMINSCRLQKQGIVLTVTLVVLLAQVPRQPAPPVTTENISVEALVMIVMIIARLAKVLQRPARAVKVGGTWLEPLVIRLVLLLFTPQCQME